MPEDEGSLEDEVLGLARSKASGSMEDEVLALAKGARVGEATKKKSPAKTYSAAELSQTLEQSLELALDIAKSARSSFFCLDRAVDLWALGRIDEAEELIKFASENSHEHGWRNIAPELAVTRAKIGMYDIATNIIAGSMFDWKPTMYAQVASVMIEAGEPDKAKNAVELGLNSIDSVTADHSNKLRGLQELALVQMELGVYDEAKQTIGRIDDVEVERSVTDGHDLQYKLQLKFDLYLKTALAQGKAEMSGEAQKSIDEAIQIADQVKEPWGKTFFYGHIASTYIGLGMYEEASAMKDKIDPIMAPFIRFGFNDEVLASLEAHLGNYEGALKLSKESAQAHVKIAEVYLKHGNYVEALTAVGKIKEKWSNSRSQISEGYQMIAVAQAEAGFFDEAKQTAHLIPDAHVESQAHSVIAIAEAKAGFFKEALETAKKIWDDRDDAGYRSGAYASIALACHKALEEAA